MRLLVIIAALCVLLDAGVSVAASDYPTRPVKVVSPYAPGGGLDVVGRPLLKKLRGRARINSHFRSAWSNSIVPGRQDIVRDDVHLGHGISSNPDASWEVTLHQRGPDP